MRLAEEAVVDGVSTMWGRGSPGGDGLLCLRGPCWWPARSSGCGGAGGRVVQSLMMRGSALHVTLRFDEVKALRETMHSAMREGADVATGLVQGAGVGTVGSTIPVTLAAVKSF